MQALHVRTDSNTITQCVMYSTGTLILCSKSPVLTRPSITFLVNPGGNTTGDMCSHANLSSLKKFLTVSTSGSTCCSTQVSRGRGCSQPRRNPGVWEQRTERESARARAAAAAACVCTRPPDVPRVHVGCSGHACRCICGNASTRTHANRPLAHSHAHLDGAAVGEHDILIPLSERLAVGDAAVPPLLLQPAKDTKRERRLAHVHAGRCQHQRVRVDAEQVLDHRPRASALPRHRPATNKRLDGRNSAF